MNINKLADITYSFIFRRRNDCKMRSLENLLPVKIKSYSLIADLQPNKSYPFKVGTYYSQDKTKLVIKVWRGPKNIHYYDLQHQIAVLKAVNSVSAREKQEMPDFMKNIHWPKLIEVINEGNMVAVVTEYIDALPIEKIDNIQKQWNYYNKVVEYLNQIWKYLNERELSQIKKKTMSRFTVLLPIIVFLAIAENPKYIFKIIKSVFCMIYALPAFLNYHKYALIHGDLNYGNILVNQKEIYLIDVEQTNVSFSEFEYVTTLSTLGNTPAFKEMITDKIIEIAKNDNRLGQRMGFLMLNCEIHNLTWNAPEENKKHYIELLEFGQKLTTGNI